MVVLGIAVLMVLAVAVLAATVLYLLSRVERASQTQQRTEQQMQQLTSAVRALELRIGELAQAPAASPRALPVAATLATVAPAPVAKKEEEVSPELLVVIAAAVTVFLGKTVRIRSAKMLQSPYEIVNPWAQQGRVFVQASHNLRTR
jgi:methylmalonyl-CoA carboxyltransferase large subunit